jgi:hypothetical protein
MPEGRETPSLLCAPKEILLPLSDLEQKKQSQRLLYNVRSALVMQV